MRHSIPNPISVSWCRIHQFEKVEQFFVTSPDNDASWAALEEMLTNAEDFYQALEVPYHVSVDFHRHG